MDLDEHLAASGSCVTVGSSEPRCRRWRHKIGREKCASVRDTCIIGDLYSAAKVRTQW
jgi:hypothetical protein